MPSTKPSVSQIAAEQGQLSAQLIVEKERVKSQIFAILTDEQKAKAVELEKEFDGKIETRTSRKARRFRWA